MIESFRKMLDVDPAVIKPTPKPVPAKMGDECPCKDCQKDRTL